jgi:toxin ParE1/3/4
MKVYWTRLARLDVQHFYGQIHEASWDAAARFRKHVRSRTVQLASFPFSGRVGPVPGTREIVLSPWPYIVVYRVEEDRVTILTVRHGAQHYSSAYLPESR